MYDINTTLLKQNFMRFAEMARLQTAHPFDTAMLSLHKYSNAGAWVTLIIQDRKIAGMRVSVPASVFTPAVEICENAGVDVKTVIVDTMIYIHTDHRGQGLSRQMREVSKENGANRDNLFMLGYGYDTPEILSWAKNVLAKQLSSTLDSQGNPVIWTKLEKKDTST